MWIFVVFFQIKCHYQHSGNIILWEAFFCFIYIRDRIAGQRYQENECSQIQGKHLKKFSRTSDSSRVSSLGKTTTLNVQLELQQNGLYQVNPENRGRFLFTLCVTLTHAAYYNIDKNATKKKANVYENKKSAVLFVYLSLKNKHCLCSHRTNVPFSMSNFHYICIFLHAGLVILYTFFVEWSPEKKLPNRQQDSRRPAAGKVFVVISKLFSNPVNKLKTAKLRKARSNPGSVCFSKNLMRFLRKPDLSSLLL